MLAQHLVLFFEFEQIGHLIRRGDRAAVAEILRFRPPIWVASDLGLPLRPAGAAKAKGLPSAALAADLFLPRLVAALLVFSAGEDVETTPGLRGARLFFWGVVTTSAVAGSEAGAGLVSLAMGFSVSGRIFCSVSNGNGRQDCQDARKCSSGNLSENDVFSGATQN